jgi:hypothetical protein
MLTRLTAAVFAVILLVGPCQAQVDKALQLIPDEALGFLMIKDLRSLSDKVNDTAQKVGVEEKVSMLELIQTEMGIKEGIAEKGSLVFILLKGKEAKLDGMRYLAALPVSDHEKVAKQLAVKDIKDGIGQGEIGTPSGLIAGVGGSGPKDKPKKFPILVAKRGDFVLLAPPESRAGLESVLKSKKDITGSMKDVREWLDQQDIAGAITNAGVNFGLGLFIGGPGGGTGSTSPEQFNQLKATFTELEKNVKVITFGGRIEKERHWRLSTAVHFQPEGSYAKWIAQAQALDGKALANFPDEPHFALLLARISAQTTFESMARYVLGDLPPAKIDAIIKERSKLIEQISEIGVCVYGGESGTFVFPKKLPISRPMNAVAIAKVRDANAFLDEAVDLLKHVHRDMRSASKTKVEVNYQEKDIAGKPSRLITVDRGNDKSKGNDKSAGKENSQRLIFLLSALDNQKILGACLPDANQAEATVAKFSKRPAKSLANDAQILQTRKLMPDQLQVEVFVDLQAFDILGKDKKTAQAPPLGFSMQALKASVEAQFVVPLEALKAVVDASKKEKEKEKKK